MVAVPTGLEAIKLLDGIDELGMLRNRVVGLENVVKSGLRLTQKKRMILREIVKISGRTTFTSAVDRVSRELSMPYSTVKWNMMKLRSSGLITAGTKDRQSLPIVVTEFGRAAADIQELETGSHNQRMFPLTKV
ncbi:MAG: hypothetical protein HYT71_00550 [Candidatus Aenigmarchaeota archaeon]|nr:hypothetical protein [Candidatus Aenigmarchaeota archaeon]